jgi:putative transposase
MIFNEASLKRILKTYFEYYEYSRTHLSLEKDAPISRAVQARNVGRVIKLPQVGGLHHRYERRAA